MLLTDQVCCPRASSSCLGAPAGELTSASRTGSRDPLDSQAPAVFWHCPLGRPLLSLRAVLPFCWCCPGLRLRVPAPQGLRVPGLSLGVQCAADQTLLHASAFCAGARVCKRLLPGPPLLRNMPLYPTELHLQPEFKSTESSWQQQRRADQARALCSAGAEQLHSQASDAGDLLGLHKLLGSFSEGNRSRWRSWAGSDMRCFTCSHRFVFHTRELDPIKSDSNITLDLHNNHFAFGHSIHSKVISKQNHNV